MGGSSGGLGPDSPSRDAANWLSSRFSRSVETRRRCGWLRIVFTRCASSELQLGAIQEAMTRDRQGALLQKVWSIGCVRTRFGEGGGQLHHRRAREMLSPCARDSKPRTGAFMREKLISDHGLFSSYKSKQGEANGQDWWCVFQGYTGLGRLDADARAGFTSIRPPSLWTSVFHLISA